MRLPAFLVAGVGRKRTFPIPFPLFPLWPLVGIGYASLWLATALLGREGPALSRLRLGLECYRSLAGLRVSVRSRTGRAVDVRFV
jgi:hypothetical protein